MRSSERPRGSFLQTGALGAVVVLAFALAACAPVVGTFTPHTSVNGVTETNADVISDAKALGVTVLRSPQSVENPLGADVAARTAVGIKTQLTIKAGTALATTPLDTAAQQTAFRQKLGAILDEYRPPLLSVENEETAEKFYAGSPAQYLVELRIATEVAKAHNVPVTDGGIPWPVVALVTWNHLRLTHGTSSADAFLATVFREQSMAPVRNELTGVSATDPDPYGHLTKRADLAGSARDAETLFAAFGTDPGDVPIDYVNFHWYVPDDVGGYKTTGYTDAQALRDAVAVIKSLTNGKQVVTNEIGQRGLTPEAVTGTLGVMVNEVTAPFVIWFDADGLPARGLHSAPGQLRPNGEAFKAFLQPA